MEKAVDSKQCAKWHNDQHASREAAATGSGMQCGHNGCLPLAQCSGSLDLMAPTFQTSEGC